MKEALPISVLSPQNEIQLPGWISMNGVMAMNAVDRQRFGTEMTGLNHVSV